MRRAAQARRGAAPRCTARDDRARRSTPTSSAGEPARDREVLRIAQEALHNALRHAAAEHVSRCACAPTTAALVLEVADDGVGFDPGDAELRSRRLGLTSMEERARRLGGAARRSARRPAAGTTVRLEVAAWLSADPRAASSTTTRSCARGCARSSSCRTASRSSARRPTASEAVARGRARCAPDVVLMDLVMPRPRRRRRDARAARAACPARARDRADELRRRRAAAARAPGRAPPATCSRTSQPRGARPRGPRRARRRGAARPGGRGAAGRGARRSRRRAAAERADRRASARCSTLIARGFAEQADRARARASPRRRSRRTSATCWPSSASPTARRRRCYAVRAGLVDAEPRS